MRSAFEIIRCSTAGLVVCLAPLAGMAQAPDPIPGITVQGTVVADPAADRAVQNRIPFTPEMIEDLGRRFRAAGEAKEGVATEVAAPANREVNMSFAPGGVTPIVQAVRGYPTVVSFFDSTGQPWPLAWVTNSNAAPGSDSGNCNTSNALPGSATGFHACTPVKGSNVMEITPISLIPRGGLVVLLEGAPKPLTFLLVGGHGRYDSSLSIHVADRGPHAKTEIMTLAGAPDTGAPFLTGILSGVPPADAVPLSVEGVSPDGLRAWRLGRNVYLRTRYTLISPGWTASEAEAGLTVYAVPSTPVVLLSVEGRTVSAALREDR